MWLRKLKTDGTLRGIPSMNDVVRQLASTVPSRHKNLFDHEVPSGSVQTER
jgi:hypothetical protein